MSHHREASSRQQKGFAFTGFLTPTVSKCILFWLLSHAAHHLDLALQFTLPTEILLVAWCGDTILSTSDQNFCTYL